MAQWDRITSRGDVHDRRSLSPAMVIGGGVSLTTLALMLVVNYLWGGDLSDVVSELEQIPPAETVQVVRPEYEGEDEYEVFASTILGSNNDLWTQLFAQSGVVYVEPKLVLFRQSTPSGCGGASSAVGPHYCSADTIIYLDETFFEELTRKFGAEGGDVAEAYVIAHEVGHHVQNELNIMDKVMQEQQRNPGSANDLSVKLELQADCLAGLWASSIKDRGVFDAGEIEEAINAAEAVGDDRIQEAVNGYVNPESWTHGSSEQRVMWFNRGYESGEFEACDTFNK